MDAGRTVVVKMITVCNETANAVAFTISIGADAAGRRIFRSVLLPAHTTWDMPVWHHLGAGERMQGFASTADAITCTISGVETTP